MVKKTKHDTEKLADERFPTMNVTHHQQQEKPAPPAEKPSGKAQPSAPEGYKLYDAPVYVAASPSGHKLYSEDGREWFDEVAYYQR